jgi:hypothetical protein
MECNYWSFTLQGGSAPGRVWLAGAEGAGGPGKAGQNHQAGGEEEAADTPGGGFGGGAVRPRRHRCVAGGAAGLGLLSRGA